MRIGHASISENGNNGRDGRAKAGDQTGKEVCIRSFYKKPWLYCLRCKDANKREIMAQACEWLCNSNLVGYDQAQRLTLHNELKAINYNYKKLTNKCECDCSSFMTALCEIANIFPDYTSGNAPVTANMVMKFKATGMFDVLTDNINEEYNLKRGDILVGAPNTHTVMVLDDGVAKVVTKRRTLKRGMSGSDVGMMQKILADQGYPVGTADGIFGKKTEAAVKQFQVEKMLVVDGICGPKTWLMLEQYV